MRQLVELVYRDGEHPTKTLFRVGAVCAPVALGLGFSAIGPVAGSFASLGIGGAGGGAAWGLCNRAVDSNDVVHERKN